MKKVAGGLCLVIVFSTLCIAQEAVSSADVPTKDDVIRLLGLLQVRARMEQLSDGMKQAMKKGAEAGFKQKVPKPPADAMEKVDNIADAVFTDMPLDEIIQAMIPIYQKHLTKSDIDGIIAFYSSPVGKKLLREQPAMMTEAMQAGQDVMLRRLPAIQDKLNTKIAQLADEEIRKSITGNAPVSK
ncbi:MAG: DUF2059 domain-containing protein [Terriglobales bacterium]